ncbi:Haloacid dehalogenase-like hydrolase domain-containing protein 3 [Trichoplax sp. H2]|uniref:Haloacid dehalogenase-like hydrolase domain-containing protein 3 n=1 Tax=Trichoplax adhaerens TaxID=10228 RepID=B3SBK9_TRIAD|nr:hypothetical protein TRIADDRAFT_32769 [Trichoplax adhaerens]EDV19906.1 hypothetical protein TRIADDRAFT_32769 [Trichoplax adhaerens]RDD40798.1 Haloacid dehalogenase-like hydrolase domain-containing protein 3 [Trichoplax sp. H2]|eukprot:XP_002117648.1 hypothetical protein TRIADDRAFT_32769 [Trichoplax adhaerens]
MPLRWIFFDATNTLFGVRSSAGEQYAEAIFKLFQIQMPPSTINRHFEIYWKQFNKTKPNFGQSSGITAKEWWHQLVTHTLSDSGLKCQSKIDTAFERLWTQYRSSPSWSVYPDVEPTLIKLKEKQLPLGIISNFDQRLHDLLPKLKLNHYFDKVITCVAAGHAKPDLGIFHYALRDLPDIPAHQCAYIGDSLEVDYYPAEKAGMISYLVQRQSDPNLTPNANNTLPTNVRTLKSLADILNYV